jgi:hypothetical protein
MQRRATNGSVPVVMDGRADGALVWKVGGMGASGCWVPCVETRTRCLLRMLIDREQPCWWGCDCFSDRRGAAGAVSDLLQVLRRV